MKTFCFHCCREPGVSIEQATKEIEELNLQKKEYERILERVDDRKYIEFDSYENKSITIFQRFVGYEEMVADIRNSATKAINSIDKQIKTLNIESGIDIGQINRALKEAGY